LKTPIRILGIAGSLRRGSYNRAALRAATELAPKGATVETFELDGIPAFNQDESADQISGPLRSILSRQANVEVPMDEVSGLDTDKRLVRLETA
jgi:NAD(P)H-dependent FMN reductase